MGVRVRTACVLRDSKPLFLPFDSNHRSEHTSIVGALSSSSVACLVALVYCGSVLDGRELRGRYAFSGDSAGPPNVLLTERPSGDDAEARGTSSCIEHHRGEPCEKRGRDL